MVRGLGATLSSGLSRTCTVFSTFSYCLKNVQHLYLLFTEKKKTRPSLSFGHKLQPVWTHMETRSAYQGREVVFATCVKDQGYSGEGIQQRYLKYIQAQFLEFFLLLLINFRRGWKTLGIVGYVPLVWFLVLPFLLMTHVRVLRGKGVSQHMLIYLLLCIGYRR